MTDMSLVIVPKCDQITADDLLSGPLTITITGVTIKGGAEQPVEIAYEGGDGKPWRPCKSMSRVLVAAWGPDAKVYAGRKVTLYRDPKVKWGGMEVGGIRISHMSHINGSMTMALTATKGSKKAFTVQPLVERAPAAPADRAKTWADAFIAKAAAVTSLDELEALTGPEAVRKNLDGLRANRPELSQAIDDALSAARARFASPLDVEIGLDAPSSTTTPENDDGWPGPDVGKAA